MRSYQDTLTLVWAAFLIVMFILFILAVVTQ